MIFRLPWKNVTVYCESCRPAARRGTTPGTATSHTGFRCVRDVRP